MRISVFGLGYIGCVSAACLAERGHQVVGVDVDDGKVEAVRAGRAPVMEPGLDDLVAATVAAGRLVATRDHVQAVRDTELSFVCVGTPGRVDGTQDQSHLRRCCRSIAQALEAKSGDHLVVVRSTILPGTMRDVVQPLLERGSGRKLGDTLGLCHNPEFLREGSAVTDFIHPSRTLIGTPDDDSADRLARLYAHIDAPLIRTDFETAELAKYADNAWHALKVGFANEVGRLAKELGVDGQRVMDILCSDTTLNLTRAYLSPGAPFGGSCLPKDLRALSATARALQLDLPILDAVLPSNEHHLERLVQRVLAHGARRIGIVGLSFKEGTGDLRESPMVAAAERLLREGCEVRLFDPAVKPHTLTGANRAYALSHLPHIERLLVGTVEEVAGHAEVLLVGHVDRELAHRLARAARHAAVIDCARIEAAFEDRERYDGICW